MNGELLRAELRRAAAEGEIDRVRNLPWGIGAAFAQGSGVPSVGPPGVFLACRTLDGERHWRYVADSGEIASAPATMLRRIDPGNAPGVPSPPVNLESAWSTAAASIIDEHNDTASASADNRSLGPIQRWALGLLEDASVSSPPSAADAYEALGAERSSLVRRDLSAIKRDLDDGVIAPDEAARRVVAVVEFHGLRAVDAPSPAPQITEDDLGVVCWMAVLPEPPQ